MTYRLVILVLTIAAIALVSLCTAGPAAAHGPHHSYVSPEWDCWEGNEGDIAVTRDLDRNRYVRWRCTCVWTQMGYKVCYWRITYVVQALWRMQLRLPMKATKNYYAARSVVRPVHWMAWHGDNGCVEHHARRYVILARHR